jgi:hypothetical protein
MSLNIFMVGDIIVYDARTSYGPSVEMTGLVVRKYRNIQDKWFYSIMWWKGGEYDDIQDIEEKIAAYMSFPKIGCIYPLMSSNPSLEMYTEADQYERLTDFK